PLATTPSRRRNIKLTSTIIHNNKPPSLQNNTLHHFPHPPRVTHMQIIRCRRIQRATPCRRHPSPTSSPYAAEEAEEAGEAPEVAGGVRGLPRRRTTPRSRERTRTPPSRG